MRLPSCKRWRTLVPAAFLAATVLLVARHAYPLPPDAGLLLWYTRLDPLLLLGWLRWEGSFPAWGWLPLAVIALTAALGRVFCGWLCPVGGLLALLHSLKTAAGRQAFRQGKIPPAWTARLYPYRFAWLAFWLALLALGSGWALYLSPFHLLTSELSRVWLRQTPWLLVALVALGLAIFPRFWCVFLCPTGLLLSLIARWRRLVVAPPADCISCGLCARVCPTGAASGAEQPAGADCLLCGRCSERCPAGRFRVTGRGGDSLPPADGSLFTRREVFRAGIALSIAAAAPAALKTATANPIRPPGALDEAEFLARCSRCGRCIKACPAQCIKAMPLAAGPAQFLTPVVVPREARCELTQDCQKVCPTGAIAHLPVAKAVMGIAEIDPSCCLAWADGKLCLVCQEQCPQHAVGADANGRPGVDTARCVGCGACENACPADPPAVVVKPQPTRRRP